VTVRVYIGLGSNLEDPVAQVLEAVEEMEMIPDTIKVGRSSLYRGKPMGPADQPLPWIRCFRQRISWRH